MACILAQGLALLSFEVNDTVASEMPLWNSKRPNLIL